MVTTGHEVHKIIPKIIGYDTVSPVRNGYTLNIGISFDYLSLYLNWSSVKFRIKNYVEKQRDMTL